MTTDAERLRAAGHTVRLASGEYPLVFDFAAVLELEKDFGSVGAISRRLQWTGPVATTINAFLRAGLRRENVTDLEDQVVLGELKHYQEAIEAAVIEAFPPPPSDGQGNGSSPGQSSPGLTTTTTAPSATDEAKATSGA